MEVILCFIDNSSINFNLCGYLLWKDVGLASELQESIKLAGDRNHANPEDQLVVRITGLEPDLVLSLDSGIALLDSVMGKRTGFIKLDLVL
ncbi:hypothetical protein KEM48_004266 [Puccinia striiformis f. sp. tritici PST-130]|nr:hypothetical protein KEM48_004266 [Puccinia striiformis f. sp. tritici PST-130]